MRLCSNWIEIRESFTNLKKITTHMYVKTQKATRKYEIVGFDSYGDPIRKLMKEPKITTTKVKVSQSCVVGGRVVGLVKFQELYYNPWGIYIGSMYTNSFLEVNAPTSSYIGDPKIMRSNYPSYLEVPN